MTPGLLPRCVYRPQPWVDRDPYDRAVRVAIDVQAVLSRPGNFEFVRRHGGQQSRVALSVFFPANEVFVFYELREPLLKASLPGWSTI
jgi:hypothetical protein